MTRNPLTRHPSYLQALNVGDTRFFTGEPCKNGHVSSRYVSGRQCVDCVTISGRESRKSYLKRRKVKAKEDPLKYQRACIAEKLNLVRKRARKNNIPYNLKSDMFLPLVEKCPVLGISLVWNLSRPSDNSPSFDRVDPELGYVEGNVNVISKRANTIKSDGTITEHRKIVKYIVKHRS